MKEVFACGPLDGELTITDRAISTRRVSYDLTSVSWLQIRNGVIPHLLAFLSLSIFLSIFGTAIWLGTEEFKLTATLILIGILGLVGFIVFFWFAENRFGLQAYLESGKSVYLLTGFVDLPTARAILECFNRAKRLGSGT